MGVCRLMAEENGWLRNLLHTKHAHFSCFSLGQHHFIRFFVVTE